MRPFVRDIELCLVNPEATIEDAVKSIDRSAIQIALVVDDNRRLLATITDGDVRRAMLAGIGFELSISHLLATKSGSDHPRPITRPVNTKDNELLLTMLDASIEHIPLTDVSDRVVDIALLRELSKQPVVQLRAMVMAGGFGTRLRPFTDNAPKPMLHVGDEPLLERLLINLRDSGIRDVSIATHYLEEQIFDHFGNGSSLGLNLNYVQEDKPLGTGGALSLLNRPDETLLVINGDILTNIDFRTMLDFHKKNEAVMTVAVRLYEVDVPYGVIECDDARVVSVREKPKYRFLVNAGIYLIEPEVWNYLTIRTRLDMPQIIERVISGGGNVISFPIREYWLDIGRPGDYQQAQEDFMSGKLKS